MCTTLANALNVIRTVENNPAWAWAQSLDLLPRMQEKVNGLEQQQRVFPLWQDIVFMKSTGELKRKYTQEQIKQEAEQRLPGLRAEVSELKTLIDQGAERVMKL
eukprot:6487154-Lingulodinium_polyedra.AAC.1